MKFKDSERVANRDVSPNENERQHEGGKESKQETTDELAERKIESAQGETEKIIADGRQRIDRLERNINLPEKDVAEVRAEVGLLGRLEKIKNGASELFAGLKEKISGLLLKKETANSQAAERGREYKDTKEYLRREQRELSAPVIREARMKRDQLLEARGLLQMPKADFNSFFASKDFEIRTDLNQRNVGDCYAVAAIHAMSRSPHFEMICRSSMKRNPDGSWQVKVPLMSESGETITITPEELSPQWNKQFLGRKKEGGVMPDLRMRLMPVKGKEGLQVLEAAFIKAKFGSVDRLAAEGGWGSEVLLQLGGDNFRQYTLNSATYNEEKKKWEYPGLSSLPE